MCRPLFAFPSRFSKSPFFLIFFQKWAQVPIAAQGALLPLILKQKSLITILRFPIYFLQNEPLHRKTLWNYIFHYPTYLTRWQQLSPLIIIPKLFSTLTDTLTPSIYFALCPLPLATRLIALSTTSYPTCHRQHKMPFQKNEDSKLCFYGDPKPVTRSFTRRRYPPPKGTSPLGPTIEEFLTSARFVIRSPSPYS